MLSRVLKLILCALFYFCHQIMQLKRSFNISELDLKISYQILHINVQGIILEEQTNVLSR